jgi:DNA-binding NtrC family response regulator
MTIGTVLYPQDFLLGNEEPESCEDPEPAPLVSTPIFEPPFLEEPLLTIEELEKQHILKAIKRTHFNKSRAAQILGIDRVMLYRKAERYHISRGEKEEPFSEPIAH